MKREEASRSGYVCQGKRAILAANKSSAHSEVEDSSRLFASPLAYDTCVLPAWRAPCCSCDSVARATRSRDRAIAKEGWRDCVNPSRCSLQLIPYTKDFLYRFSISIS